MLYKRLAIILLLPLTAACGQQPAKMPVKAESVRPVQTPLAPEEQQAYFPPDRVPGRNPEAPAQP